MEYGYIEKSPFLGFKIKTVVNPRMYLTEEEVCRIREAKLPNTNTCISRDLFLLMCNTGLAFSDLCALDPNTIESSLSGKVIRGERIKTKTSFMVPLTQEAQTIIEKYSGHRIAKQKNTMLPVFSNQTFNKHLKVIGKAARINKELTSHVGRHSFATTALTAGVPLVTIQRTLGHSDLRMTLHYSRLIDKKLEEDMDAFKTIMDKQTNKNKPQAEDPPFQMRAV
jgi:site-specific recombinase XerD